MDRGGEWRWRESDTFVLRVFRGAEGAPAGLVRHVRTGTTLPFQGLASLGEALAGMMRRPGPTAPGGSGG